jgi:hypothetical protein
MVLARLGLPDGRTWTSPLVVMAQDHRPARDCLALPNFLGMLDVKMLTTKGVLQHDATAPDADLDAYFGPSRAYALDHDYANLMLAPCAQVRAAWCAL